MNGLGFTSAGFLWLLPLAALPVVFHLFFRVRRKTIPFSTFMFFHRIDPRLSARRKLREWLILLLRILALLFLILSLAGFVSRGAGGGGITDAVLVIDNSGSMAGRGAGGETKLARAVEGAETVLGTLARGDGAAVVLLVDDPATALPPGLVPDRELLKTALRRIGPTEAGGRPAEALGRAFALLGASRAARFEVHVFPDLQETEWRKSASGLAAPRAGTSLQFHRVASPRRTEPNVAIAGIDPLRERQIAGRRVPVGVRLQNTGQREAEVRLQSEDDQGKRRTDTVRIPAREQKSVVVVQQPDTAGMHWMRLWIEGDGFEADNRATVAFDCAAREGVLFLGEGPEFGLLPLAVAPSGDGTLSGLWPIFAKPDALEATWKDRAPALLVATCQSLAGPAAAALRAQVDRYVTQGGHLLVVPSATDPAPGPWTFEGWHASLSAAQTDAQGLPLLIFRKDHRLFEDLRDAKGDVVFRNVRAFRFHEVKVPDAHGRLSGLEDGRVVLAEVPEGQGSILLSGVAFHPDWSTLPLKGYFLPIAQSMALSTGNPGAAVTWLVAGERPRIAAGTNVLVQVRSAPGTPPLEWKGPAAEVPAIPRSGLYTVAAGTNLLYVAARCAPDEAGEAYVTGDAIPAAGALRYTVDSWDRPEDLAQRVRLSRKGRDFSGPLLLLAFLALLAEGVLINILPAVGGAAWGFARTAAALRSVAARVKG